MLAETRHQRNSTQSVKLDMEVSECRLTIRDRDR
jgi:hypothetical protein